MKKKQSPTIKLSVKTKSELDKFISAFERNMSYEEAVMRLLESERNSITLETIYNAIKTT